VTLACVPGHVLIQRVAADVGEAPTLGSRDRLQGGPRPGGDPDSDLRRRACAWLTADAGAAAEASADLNRVADDLRPAGLDAGAQLVGLERHGLEHHQVTSLVGPSGQFEQASGGLVVG
jgi:hypothetical protein